tara:strand:- start:636 stop:1007 length:372 start_codon:yes stop_codon:yes gene_type:complete
MDITKLPESVIMTAAMAMFLEEEKFLDICAGVTDTILKGSEPPEGMEDGIKQLTQMFMDQIPPGLDTITHKDAKHFAKGVIGLGGVISIHEELENAVMQTFEMIVEGTKTALQNFGNFVADNE